MGEELTNKSVVMIPPVFLVLFSTLLSFAWTMPNHTPPWTTFHSDALAGVVLLIVAAWVLLCSSGKLEFIGCGLLFLALAAVPWLQYLFGVIYSFGTAWINSLYLVGLSIAIFAGWHWEKSTPGQCLDFLFMAVFLAAFLSIGIQLQQWLRIEPGNLWFFNTAGTSRFFANMGQPNQLASLLLLAALGVAWGYARKRLGAAVSIGLVSYLLFGIALTESRTAWLNVAGILVALSLFWGEVKPKFFNLVLLVFGFYFLALYFSLPVINDLLFGEEAVRREISDPVRLGMWKSLTKAILDRPFWGYGWGQTTEAVFSRKDFPSTSVMMMHSHNIVLDMFLYNGILLGGSVFVVFGLIFQRFLKQLSRDFLIIPFLAICLLLVHSLLELPLHYAYFLLPFGMILGVLGWRSGLKVWCSCSKQIGYASVIAVSSALLITISDCFEAERTFFSIHYGKRGHAIPPEELPKLRVLSQWDDRLRFANSTPEEPLPPEKYAWMKGVVVTTPNPALIFKFAQNLALNGRSAEAREWLENLCKVVPERLVRVLADEWDGAAENNASYGKVKWSGCNYHTP